MFPYEKRNCVFTGSSTIDVIDPKLVKIFMTATISH
jgi:hypothetical protein